MWRSTWRPCFRVMAPHGAWVNQSVAAGTDSCCQLSTPVPNHSGAGFPKLMLGEQAHPSLTLSFFPCVLLTPHSAGPSSRVVYPTAAKRSLSGQDDSAGGTFSATAPKSVVRVRAGRGACQRVTPLSCARSIRSTTSVYRPPSFIKGGKQ